MMNRCKDTKIPPQRGEKGKLFIGRLSWETRSETLLKYFSRYGEVIDCIVMKNKDTGCSRGFGFVTYKDPKCVDLILSGEPHIIDGRQVDPKACNPRTANKAGESKSEQTVSENQTKKVFVGGLPFDVDEGVLIKFFSKYGKVKEASIMYDLQKGRSRGFGFLTFENEDSVDEVCQQHFVTIKGKQVECKRAEPLGRMKGDQNSGQALPTSLDQLQHQLMLPKDQVPDGLSAWRPPSAVLTDNGNIGAKPGFEMVNGTSTAIGDAAGCSNIDANGVRSNPAGVCGAALPYVANPPASNGVKVSMYHQLVSYPGIYSVSQQQQFQQQLQQQQQQQQQQQHQQQQQQQLQQPQQPQQQSPQQQSLMPVPPPQSVVPTTNQPIQSDGYGQQTAPVYVAQSVQSRQQPPQGYLTSWGQPPPSVPPANYGNPPSGLPEYTFQGPIQDQVSSQVYNQWNDRAQQGLPITMPSQQQQHQQPQQQQPQQQQQQPQQQHHHQQQHQQQQLTQSNQGQLTTTPLPPAVASSYQGYSQMPLLGQTVPPPPNYGIPQQTLSQSPALPPTVQYANYSNSIPAVARNGSMPPGIAMTPGESAQTSFNYLPPENGYHQRPQISQGYHPYRR